MLFLRQLSLLHFKNYRRQSFSFTEPVVCLCGLNGTGKTTVLDAIHFLCFTKSYFLHQDIQAVTVGEAGMRLAGTFAGEPNEEVIFILRENGKKEFSCGGEGYARFSQHIGRFPCVFISPDDTELISGGSELRRKFLDVLISQTDPAYMQHLIAYNRTLQQRNALLKQWHELDESRRALLDVYDGQLAQHGTELFTTRRLVAARLGEKAQRIYEYLTDSAEQVETRYSSRLEDMPLSELLKVHRQKDILSQRSNYGIHKDELVLELNGMPFRQVASQGQRKSFLFGLKLAEFEWIREQRQTTPILLLDDVFEKLDAPRSEKLIRYVVGLQAQLFITDTHRERLEQSLGGVTEGYQVVEL